MRECNVLCIWFIKERKRTRRTLSYLGIFNTGWGFVKPLRIPYFRETTEKISLLIFPISSPFQLEFSGFGNVVTKTDTGKTTTMFYSIPGVGLAVTTYSILAKGLLTITKIVIYFLEIRMLCRKVIKYFNLKVLTVQVALIVAFVFIQASISILDVTENYRFLDAVYFVVTTLITIGFGDFEFNAIAYHERLHLFVISVVCHFGGFGLVALLIRVVSEMITSSKLLKKTDMLIKHSKQKKDKVFEKYSEKKACTWRFESLLRALINALYKWWMINKVTLDTACVDSLLVQ